MKNFGKQVPIKRPGQPAELATAYVVLADPLFELRIRRDDRRHWRKAVPVKGIPTGP